jgi:hypothetical protein
MHPSKTRYERDIEKANRSTTAEKQPQAAADENYVDEEREPDEQKLMNHILRGYEKSVRPVRNATSTVLIKMGLTMTQIFDMVCNCFPFRKRLN